MAAGCEQGAVGRVGGLAANAQGAGQGRPEVEAGGPREVVAQACRQYAVVLEQQVHVGGVDVEADQVGQGHAGLGQDGLQVVQAQCELRRHVAGVLGLAVVAHRGLS